MVKSKEALAKEITTICKRLIVKQKITKECVNKLETIYDIPPAISTDILTLRTPAENNSEYILFCILNIFIQSELTTVKLTDYFTAEEIEQLSKVRFTKEKIKFPIKIKMIQVTDNQWIGATDVHELMKYRDAQLINYNENAQRTLKRMFNNGVEYYQIAINKSAVNAIMDSYKSNTYIPNTITLNMPEDTEFVFDGEYLIIKAITSFDILDGYHRYIGMSNDYNIDNNFNYPMELRIVCFPEEMSKQFIYQEDQKTKMNKADSNSFNQNSPGNQIVNMLNKMGFLTGIINTNECIIDAAAFGSAIDSVYFTKKNSDRKHIIEVRDLLYKNLGYIMDVQPGLLNQRWMTQYIVSFTYISSIYSEPDEVYKHTKELFELIINDQQQKQIFSARDVKKSLITRISKIAKEGGIVYV